MSLTLSSGKLQPLQLESYPTLRAAGGMGWAGLAVRAAAGLDVGI